MLLVLTTCADEKEARRIAAALVTERLAACVSVIPAASVFFWKGKLRSASERLLIAKTGERKYRAVEARIKQLHGYELPEIIALRIARGSKEYMKWVENETK
jgi:periplasmic divalent cation tolerance protein